MTDLAEFLRARIADDELNARNADADQPWSANMQGDLAWIETQFTGRSVASFQRFEDAWHAAWWQPLRALAECEAKRRIVEHHARVPDDEGDPAADLCAVCSANGPDAQGWPCDTLRLLTLPYADHPDYRSEWRP